ncbi:universal stress protein [Streptomyces venezuelae]|uniref:universal stress protein n=1 Tax=Streptomyces venezuelae TaxID=54571 RepID=UPI0037A1CC8D
MPRTSEGAPRPPRADRLAEGRGWSGFPPGPTVVGLRGSRTTTEESMAAAVRAPVVVSISACTHRTYALSWGADEADRLRLPLRVMVAMGRSTRRTPTGVARPRVDHRDPETSAVPLGQAIALVKTRHPHLEVSTLPTAEDFPSVLRKQTRGAAAFVFETKRAHRTPAPCTQAGAVGFRVLTRAMCPVVILPAPGRALVRPYFVVGADLGWDGRRHSAAALHHAFERAALQDAELRVLHVWHPPVLGVLDERAALRECRRLLAETVACLRTLHPTVHVRHSVLRGPVAAVLTKESAHSLGLIVGCPRRGGAVRLPFRSIVARVLRQAQCPVIVVPRAGTYPHPHRWSRVGRLARLSRKAVGRCIRLPARAARLRPGDPTRPG